MKKNRLALMLVALICLFVLLIGRLMQIQLISSEQFSKHKINLVEASVEQRSQQLEIDNGRGRFLDRHRESLIDEKFFVLILFPFLKTIDWDIKSLSDIIDVPEKEILEAIEKAKEPFVFRNPDLFTLTERQVQQINQLKIPGVFAVEKRFPLEHQLAQQLIGIAGENEKELQKRYPGRPLPKNTLIGLTGLEKSFDEFLLSEGTAKLVYHVDGLGGPLFGINVKYVEPANPFYPVNIITTIDKDLQKLAEDIVDEHKIEKGGLILLDIKTNSVLALVSRPKINWQSPFESDGIRNMMLSQHIPGSVFKTVVAAAAIEKGLDDPARLFDCDVTITGRPDQKYRHGQLNFIDSFARSCNNTFATLAKELIETDENVLEEFAKKLNLLGPVGWTGDFYHFVQFQQFADEEKGRIFLQEEAKKDRNFVAMTGIGQHEVRVTPIGVANMMATIARGGKGKMVQAVSGVEYKNGTSLLHFEEKEMKNGSISPYTAMKLQKLLREVVTNEEGTGKLLQNLPFSVAGKSGTAETGLYEGKEQLLNKWFAGYFPFENPRYVLVTVNLEVKDNEGGVLPLFSRMVEELHKWEKNENKLDE